MPTKSIHKKDYAILLRQLRELRLAAGLTQVELSTALGRPQSYVSDVERGNGGWIFSNYATSATRAAHRSARSWPTSSRS